MIKYTSICNKEQTLKAIALGAPIEAYPMIDMLRDEIGKTLCLNEHTGEMYMFPTTQQMLAWLEEKGIMIEVYYSCSFRHYNYNINFRGRNGWGSKIFNKLEDFDTRESATLVAINKALEHMSKQNN